MNQYKISSWNVNGIRSINRKQKLTEFIDIHRPDIICLQEIRCSDSHLPKEIFNMFPDYKYAVTKCSVKNGYAGVAVLSKIPLTDLSDSIVIDFENTEGRLNVIAFEDFVLVNSYTPNSQGCESSRYDYRVVTWDNNFRELVNNLQKDYKRVIVCGDLNVAHLDIDVFNCVGPINKSAGFTKTERENFTKLLNQCDMVDAFRLLHPNDVAFTWWSNFSGAREKNRGMRLDYFVVSKDKFDISDVVIHKDVLGSDHAPLSMMFS